MLRKLKNTPDGNPALTPPAPSKAIPALLFVFMLSLYLFTMEGVPMNGDPEAMYLVAQGLVSRGSVALSPNPDIPLAPGRNGRYYAKFGIGQSLAEVPFVALANRYTANSADSTYKYYIGFLAASAVTPLVSAVSCLLLMMILSGLGARRSVSALTALIYGAGTMAWPLSKFAFSEPLQTVSLLASVYFAVRCARDSAGWRTFFSAAAAGFFTGFIVAVKAVMVVLLPFVFIYVVFSPKRGGGKGTGRLDSLAMKAVAFAAPALGWIAVALIYNYARFGNPLDFGYTAGHDSSFGFSTPVLSGLYGLLFSPGKSVFIYSPVIIAGVLAAGCFHAKFKRESFLLWGMAVAATLLYCKWWAWHGDSCWGPRFLMPCVPLAIIPAGIALDKIIFKRDWRKTALALLAAVSIAVQIPATCVNFNEYLRITTHQVEYNVFYISGQGQLRDSELAAHFIPEFSPVAGHFWAFRHALLAAMGIEKNPGEAMKKDFPWRDLTRYAAPADPGRAAGFDFWHRLLPAISFFPQASYMAAVAGKSLAALCAASFIALCFAFKAAFKKESDSCYAKDSPGSDYDG